MAYWPSCLASPAGRSVENAASVLSSRRRSPARSEPIRPGCQRDRPGLSGSLHAVAQAPGGCGRSPRVPPSVNPPLRLGKKSGSGGRVVRRAASGCNEATMATRRARARPRPRGETAPAVLRALVDRATAPLRVRSVIRTHADPTEGRNELSVAPTSCLRGRASRGCAERVHELKCNLTSDDAYRRWSRGGPWRSIPAIRFPPASRPTPQQGRARLPSCAEPPV